MFELDDLEVISRATLPYEVYARLKDEKFKLSQLRYVGVDDNDFHCYIRPDNTILRLPERIEA